MNDKDIANFIAVMQAHGAGKRKLRAEPQLMGQAIDVIRALQTERDEALAVAEAALANTDLILRGIKKYLSATAWAPKPSTH